MFKKKLSAILAVTTLLTGIQLSSVHAEALETTQITQIVYNQDFENYTAESGQNGIISIGNSDDKALFIKRTDLAVDNIEKITFDTAISQDIVELEFLVLPRETAGEKAEAYIQLFQGSSSARLNVKISCDNGDLNKYRIKVGSKEVIGKEDLYHLPKNAEDDGANFTKENFNKIKMIMHRVNVDGDTDNELSKFYVYLNGELKGTYTFAEIGTGGIGYTQGKTIEMVRVYQYRYDTGEPLDEEVYFDDIVVKGMTSVEYYPSELEMNFDVSMNYSNDEVKLVLSNGTDTSYLEQKYSVKLINADDENDETEVALIDAVKAQDDKAEFSFEGAVTVNPGWYFVDVQRVINGEIKGSGKSRKIYVATPQQLEELPVDFSLLPENDEEAQNLIKYYFPCFLTEEEITEILPEEYGELTQKAKENLAFITKYFKENNASYAEISDVYNDFIKAKGYLELKNAQTMEEVFDVLTRGNYLADYVENSVLTENTEEFFSHFETRRNDNESPLVSDEKINMAIRYSMAMTSLNKSERSGIESVVEEYNDDVFELDLEKVTVDNKDSLYSSLYNKAYTSLETLREDWEEAVNDLPETPVLPPELEEEEKHPSSGGSSGGGGGGGSFGGGSVSKKDKADTLAPRVEPTDITPETENETKLTDTEGHWAEKEITELYNKGYITGFEDLTFRPENTLTRAELVTILARILPDVEISSENQFADVNENDWYYSSVMKAAQLGITNGSDGKFNPDDFVTREQFAVMLYRALKAEKTAGEITFTDKDMISDYATDAIGYLLTNNIISGYEDNTVRPKNFTTRAEAAKMLYGLTEKLAEN